MAKVNFLQALETIEKAVPVVTAIVFGVTISGVVVGVLLYQINAGNITMESTIQAFLNGSWVTSVVSFLTSFGTALTVTMGLLIVVIVIVLFRTYLGNKSGGDSM